ncbi:MAG: hypothetical protein K2N11_07480, partial [Mucispirillum sp.]|nr:hypothetical protein [Mucispirillum sp.]
IAGCSDDDNGGDGAAFPTDLLGTYNVTFFGTQVTNAKPSDPNDESASFYVSMADLLYVSNDCAKAKELYPDIIDKEEPNGFGGTSPKNSCQPTDENDKGTAELLDGVVVINNADGQLGITSRVQLGGQAMDTFAPADKYQYTEYYPTSDFANYEGKGVRGWNYDSAKNKPSETSTEFPESPYKIIKQDDGSLRIDMTLVGKKVNAMSLEMVVDAVTTVIMTKASDSTEQLENQIKKEFPSSAE